MLMRGKEIFNLNPSGRTSTENCAEKRSRTNRHEMNAPGTFQGAHTLRQKEIQILACGAQISYLGMDPPKNKK